MRCPLSRLATASPLLLLCFVFLTFSAWPTFAKGKNGLVEELSINLGAAHFVAVNGNDDGPGNADRPWATINHAAEQAKAGETVVVRGGRYVLPAQVRVKNSGRPGAWITFVGYPGEVPVLDGQELLRSELVKDGLDNGSFQIEGVSYVRVANLTVINSHDAGFTVRDSSNIDLINNSTKGTFSSGIAVWSTSHDGGSANHIRVIGNTIIDATTWNLAPSDMPRHGKPPHEALSIGGAVDFEVAYNHVYDSDKEGIDIKETSRRGKVHHNLVHNMNTIGIYVDAWFGKISDLEIFSNVIHDCRLAGITLSVENGQSDENINIHNNLIFNNDGSGLFFSRWGVNNLRRNIQIAGNIFFHNGYGPPKDGQMYYWLTGGLYLYSTSVRAVSVRNNIFSDNRGFQIGYSDLFVKDPRSWPTVARAKQIQIAANLIDGRNTIHSPIESGGDPADRVKIYAVNGNRPIFHSPLFKDAANQDFTPRRGSPRVIVHVATGAYAPGSPSKAWWKSDFPPRMVHTGFDRSKRGKVL
jgi:hypothetical protein